jgi:EpsI family protein
MLSLNLNPPVNTALSLKRYRSWLVPVIAFASVLCVLPVWWTLGEYWFAVADYSYGVLIVIVAAAWLWYSRHVALDTRVTPSFWLAPLLIATLLLWYSLWQGHSEMGAQLLMPVVMWLSFALALGWRASIPLISPVAYLYYSMPIWDQLLPWLQQSTVWGAANLMRLLGVSVTVNGNYLVIPEGTFNVLFECSGLRYLIVALALASLTAALEKITRMRLLIFFLATVTLAIIANWVRVAIVMYAGHVTGMSHYFVADNHKGLGNVVFAVLLLLIFLVARGIQPKQSTAEALPSMVDRPAPRLLLASITVLGLLCATGLLAARAASNMTFEAGTPQLSAAPMLSGEWQGPYASTSSWMPEFIAATDALRLAYRSSNINDRDYQVELYINVYGKQQQGAELIYFRNNLQAPGQWQKISSLDVPNVVASALGTELRITEHVSGTERWVFGQTYVVGGHQTGSALFAQLLYGKTTLTRAAPAGVVALAVRCRDECARAKSILRSFWFQMEQQLVATVPTILVAGGSVNSIQ